MTLEEDDQFTEFLRAKAREGKAAVGYPATLFMKMLNAEGGFQTVNRLLAAPRISDGYSALVSLGRVDLTVEALVIETRWRKFIDPQLLEVAETRLRRTGYEFKRFVELASKDPPTAAAPVGIVERPLPLASPDAIAAAEWLKSAYGAVLTWESRKEGKQQEDTPVRIYTLPSGAQAAIRMNKISPALYVCGKSPLGEDIKDALAAITPITGTFTGTEKREAPSSILSHAPYLKPGPTNILLRLNPKPGLYLRVFALALGAPRRDPPMDGADTGGTVLSRPPRTPSADVARRMLETVKQTVAQSGTTSTVTAKNKEFRFASDSEFLRYMRQLLEDASGRCQLTGVLLSDGDPDLAPSLDRKDSDGHYEAGNLQIVARFANRWKSDQADIEFKRLLDLVRDSLTKA